MSLLHFVQLEKDWIDSAAASDMADALGLDTDTLIGKVARVWAWSLDNAAPKGCVGGRNPTRAIEEAAHWNGKRGAFVAAAINYGGILKRVEDRFLFRGWEKRYGAILEKAAKWAEAKRNQRSKKDVRQDVFEDILEDTEQDGGRSDQDLDLDHRDLPPPTPSHAGPQKPVAVVEKQLWTALQENRIRRGQPEELPPRSFARFVVEALAAGFTAEDLDEAHQLYLADGDFGLKRWPTAVFCRPGVYHSRAKEAKASRLERERTAPPALPDNPAGRAWGTILERLRTDGKTYALGWLQRMFPLDIDGDGQLSLACPDSYYVDWVEEHYGALLREQLPAGVVGLDFTIATGLEAAQ